VSDLKLSAESEPHRLDLFIPWICRTGVALAFVWIGASKFYAQSSWIRTFEQIGVGQWLRYATGLLQVAGGVLLLSRRTAVVGAVLAGCTMAGAVAAQLFILHGGPIAIVPAILLAALVAVGWQAYASRV
jgi:putative oxidoreductase